MAIDHALAHAAGKLVRILAHDPFRRADMDVAEQLQHPCLGGSPVHADMQAQHVGDLAADPIGRVERGHRVLGDQAEAPAHQAAAVPLWQVGDVPAVEADRTGGNPRAGRLDAQDDLADHGLAGAGFADQPVNLAGRDIERHIAQDRRVPPPAGDRQMERPDGEDGALRRCSDGHLRIAHLRITGSSTSFSPSPRAFSARTRAMTQKIGRIISQGAWFTYLRPSAIMVPQVGKSDASDRFT